MGVKIGGGINLGGSLRAIKSHHTQHQKRHTSHHKQAIAYVRKQKQRAVKGSGLFSWLDDKEKKLKQKYADAKARAQKLIKDKAELLRKTAAEAKQKVQSARQTVRAKVQAVKQKAQSARGRVRDKAQEVRDKAQGIRGRFQGAIQYGRGRVRSRIGQGRGRLTTFIGRGRGRLQGIRTGVKTRLGTTISAGKDVMARYRKIMETRKRQAKEHITKHFDKARDGVSKVVREVDKKVGQGIKVGGALRLLARRGPKKISY